MILNINNNKFIMPIQRNNAPSFKSLTPAALSQPPEKDSFTSKIKRAFHPAVQNVIERAQLSYNIFQSKIDIMLFDCTRSDKRDPANALGRIQSNDTNFKRGKEKIKKLRMRTGQEAKDFINDEGLISARIILDKGTQAEGNRVFNWLIKAAENKSLIVREIRTYGENPQSLYVSQDKIKGLLEKMNDLGYACGKFSQRKVTGYHAIHVKCQLEDGLIGTLEIMGGETSKVKDVEDVLNRLSKGKPVDEKFAKVEQAYSQLTDQEKTRLTSYTKDLYMQARRDEMSKQTREGFAPITNYNLPEIFDFNNLAKIA